MQACSALGCSNSPSKKIPGITFHRFPLQTELHELWVKALRRRNFTPSNSAVVCSEHFEEDSFDRASCFIRLKQNSVPSIFKAFPNYSEKNYCSTLPTNLCFKPLPGGRWKVLSNEAISIGTRFGPYEGASIEKNEQENGHFQWEMEWKGEVTRDGCNGRESNWLQFINYTCSKELHNLIAVKNNSRVYYLTSRNIPENAELLVLCQGETAEDTSHRKGNGVVIQENTQYPQGNSHQIAQKEGIENKYSVTHVKGDNICNNEIPEDASREHFQNDTISSGISSEYQNFGQESINKSDLPFDNKANADGKHFQCIICLKSFENKNHLYLHERHHSGKPFKCDFCEESFSAKLSLIRHKRTHSDERPYECNFCGKVFTEERYLRCHKRFHTGEKPFACSFCGMSFTRKDYLTCHKRIHTGQKPFMCNFCGKAFKQKSHLMSHQKIHTGEKPFTCNFCGKAFIERGMLTRHEKIHTGEKPFNCDFCGKAFIQKGHLTRHKRIHT